MAHSHGRRKGLPKPVSVLLVFALLAGVIGGALFAGSKLLDSFGGGPDDYAGPGQGEVTLKVDLGDTAGAIATELVALDVVKSREAFIEVANADERSRGIQPGSYVLRGQMSAAGALELLLDPDSMVRANVVIPEGFNTEQILARLAEETGLPLERLQAASKDTAALGVPEWVPEGEIEGVLFPATYGFEPDATPGQVLREMVDRFKQEVVALDLETRAAALDVTPYEALVIASLAEREARKDDEFGKVTRVIYNRLDKGMRLEIDATVLYGLGRTSGGLTRSDLAKDTPYNTRLNTGLPPTPIAAPGALALEAALAPEEGDWIYYVLASEDGTQFYTEDYDEFLEQKRKSGELGLL